MEMEAMYSDAGIVVGFTMPRPPSRTGRASRFHTFRVTKGSLSCYGGQEFVPDHILKGLEKARINCSCLHKIVPFAGRFMGKCRISSLWLAFSKFTKLCDFFTPVSDLGTNQFIGEVLVTNG